MVKMVINSRSGSHHAEGVLENNVITVKKGSKICLKDSYDAMPMAVRLMRHDISIVGKDGILKQDTKFDSPTAAAQFVTGRSVNGYIVWRPDNKTTLKKYIRNSIEKVEEG